MFIEVYIYVYGNSYTLLWHIRMGERADYSPRSTYS